MTMMMGKVKGHHPHYYKVCAINTATRNVMLMHPDVNA